MLTPLQAIRQKCLDCCCGYSREVARCPFDNCSLYPFRFGKNPNSSNRVLSEAQRNALKRHSYEKPRDKAEGLAREDVSEGKYTSESKNAKNAN